jgi:hypothetical protein
VQLTVTFCEDRSRREIPICATKYWVRVRQSVKEEQERRCFKWQVGQPKMEYWAQRLRDSPIRLDYATHRRMRERQK